MDGLLVIDKPVGPTSHDVVARMRRVLRERRIGHTGTLDPMASGVLPLVVGRATRLARFYAGASKRYTATLRLGSETDTYDALGVVTAVADPGRAVPTVNDIDAVLARFRGTFAQCPPRFSAKKVDGDRAYDLARRGLEPTLPAVEVVVSSLNVVAYAESDGLVTLDVTSSAGFYVRSLAFDIGRALGCGAHLTALRRTSSGTLTEAQALDMDVAERDPDRARERLLPLSALLPDRPAVTVTEAGRARALHGNLIRQQDAVARQDGDADTGVGITDCVRVLSTDGHLLALAETGPDGAAWPLHPTVVLS